MSVRSRVKTMAGLAALAAVIGSGAAGLVVPLVAEHEGEVLTTYIDPVGVPTVCFGDTDPGMAIPGVTYSVEECLDSLGRQLLAHAGPVVECTPSILRSPEMTAAAVSLAYNIGTGAYCRSTAARRFNSGDYAGGCAAFEMWVNAGGRKMRGLVKRRADERRLCEQGIPAMEAAQ